MANCSLITCSATLISELCRKLSIEINIAYKIDSSFKLSLIRINLQCLRKCLMDAFVFYPIKADGIELIVLVLESFQYNVFSGR